MFETNHLAPVLVSTFDDMTYLLSRSFPLRSRAASFQKAAAVKIPCIGRRGMSETNRRWLMRAARLARALGSILLATTIVAAAITGPTFLKEDQPRGLLLLAIWCVAIVALPNAVGSFLDWWADK
jgi:hypothetical protein